MIGYVLIMIDTMNILNDFCTYICITKYSYHSKTGEITDVVGIFGCIEWVRMFSCYPTIVVIVVSRP